MDEIIVIGHKKPDLDSVASAYAYSYYKNKLGEREYRPALFKDENEVTEWAFEKFEAELPKQIEDISGKKVVLVDHNEEYQRPDGWEDSDILEIIDHHQLSDSKQLPGKLTVLPYGSTSTIIGEKIIVAEIEITKALAGVILSAIIDDTLALRSPTTVKADKLVANHMAEVAGINDLSDFCRELWKNKDIWTGMDVSEIVNKDSKKYEFGEVNVKISQIETLDNRNLHGKEKEMIKFIKKEAEDKDLDLNIVMVTDVIRGDGYIISAGENKDDLIKIFNSNLSNGTIIYLPGVISRKSQVVPYLEKFYS